MAATPSVSHRRDALLAAISLNRGELDPERLLRLLGRLEPPARRPGLRRGRR
jgi:hypothetical protein